MFLVETCPQRLPVALAFPLEDAQPPQLVGQSVGVGIGVVFGSNVTSLVSTSFGGGMGAAGISCVNMLVELGVKPENVLAFDRDGVIHTGRTDLDPEKARLAALQTLSTIGEDILERNLSTFIVTRQIRPLTKDRLARRKSRKDDSEESDNAFALSKGWLTIPQAAKRFPFTEGAIRHMIFQAEAYVRVKKRPSKANSTKKKPYVPDGFLDVIVRIPNKRRVFLDEKKFAAWMAQSQGV
mgnify:CR=1 FL=1